MTIKKKLKSSIAASVVAATVGAVGLTGAGNAAAFPEYGMGGLCPNASALANYISANYPGVQSIGGVRQDRLPDHPSGHAIDIMIGSNMGLGDMIASDMRSNGNFGIKYVLWRVKDHFNHVHVTVF